MTDGFGMADVVQGFIQWCQEGDFQKSYKDGLGIQGVIT